MNPLITSTLLACLAFVLGGCVHMEPGVARNLVNRRHALKPEALNPPPRRIGVINSLPPVLYINNAEGNFWAGKSAFVPAAELAALNKLIDESLSRELQNAFAQVEVRRLTRAEAREATDLDWIVELAPNGFIVPDFTWGDFAKLVLLGSAQVASGVPPAMAVQPAPGDPAAQAGQANRPAYTMGTNPIYGTIVSASIAWHVYRGRTWQELGSAEISSNVLLRIGKMKKLWSDWTPEQQASVWHDLQTQAPSMIVSHLTELGIKPGPRATSKMASSQRGHGVTIDRARDEKRREVKTDS